MASRSDQLHSHQFTLHRVVGALAMRDPDPASSPMRRIGGALFAGVMLAALALAAVGVYGVLRPGGNNSWRDGGSVIVERESGARFVFRDGVLHPVLNYSSALLILGSAQPKTALVARGSLADVPRGTPLGIPGAPDLLPTPGELISRPWTLCSRTRASAAPASSAESVLLIGAGPASAPQSLDQRALLGLDPTGGLHVIWNRHRFAIPAREESVVLAAFTWTRQAATPVAPAVLNAVPAGPDLARIPIAGRGGRSTMEGYRVGQVLYVENQTGARQYGVVLSAGLADITQVQADLLLAANADPTANATRMTQAQYASAPRAASLMPSGEAATPAATPELAPVPAAGGPCALFVDGAAPPDVSVAASLAAGSGEILAGPAGGVAGLGVGVDRVVVAPGRGAVVEALAGPGSPSGSISVVSDLGMRYPVPSVDVLAMLGYRGVRPQQLPASVVALLPAGRALDPAAARLPSIRG